MEKKYRPLTEQEAVKAMNAGRRVSLRDGEAWRLDRPHANGVGLVSADGHSFTAFYYETLVTAGTWSDTNEPCGVEVV